MIEILHTLVCFLSPVPQAREQVGHSEEQLDQDDHSTPVQSQSTLQLPVSSVWPAHGRPPQIGGLQLRLLFLVPVILSHASHLDHSEKKPSTGQQFVLQVLFLVNGSLSSTSYFCLHVLPPLASLMHTRSLVCTPGLPPGGVHNWEQELQASLNSLQTQSTGQSTMSQKFSFELGPLHSAPPC